MALDPRIPLQAQAPDLLAAVQGGLNVASRIREQPLREALMREQAKQASLNQERLAQNRFIGTPQRVERDGQNYLVGLVQQPNGAVTLSETPVQGEFTSGLGETAEEQFRRILAEAQAKARIGVEAEGSKVSKKGTASRLEDAINAGLDATESVSDIGRAFELLQTVDTGKPEEVALRAKQFFGIEATDAAELKTLLGRAVIANLRSSFGGNPTEGERAALAEIETAFSQQGGVNERLLNRTLTRLERRVDRGVAGAKKSGDDFALEKLEEVKGQIDQIKNFQKPETQKSSSGSSFTTSSGIKVMVE